MADEILEKIKSNNKEIKKIKVRMAIFKYLEITTLISGGIYLLENIIKNSVYGLLNSIIVTTISSIPYGLMAYGARYLYKKNRVKRRSIERINKELNNSDDYSNDNEKAKEEIKEDVKKETVIKEENKIKEERDSKIRKLKELAERTYTLRRNFVKDFTLNEKATSKNLQNFIITALLEDNDFDIEKFIEMLDVEYDEDDLDEMQGVREVYERSNKTLQNKMVIAGYVLYNDRKTNDCYDYTGNHRENESLQRLYDGLITIGYEMSDEELAMMDGTHELYTTEDE